jgi:phage FluMu gp28-like protein
VKKAATQPRAGKKPAPVSHRVGPPVAPKKKPAAAAVEKALAPAVLLSYQQDWVAGESEVALWEKSRRIGASWCDASDSVLTAAAAEGMDMLYIGYSEDMTREYIDDCAMWARAFNRAAGAMQEVMFDDTDDQGNIRQIKAFRIDFASGSKILALSSRPRSIRGKQGKITIDEAAYHDDLPGLMKAALAMLIWGGRVRILSSHNGEDNHFNLMLKDCRAGKLPYTIYHTTFADALLAGLYERVKLVMGERMKEKTRAEWEAKVRAFYGEDAAEELDCIPKQGSGVYIPRSVVERCQREGIPVLRLAKKPEWTLDSSRLEQAGKWIKDVLKPAIDAMDAAQRSVFGLDFGRSGDLSYISILQDQTAGRWRERFALEMRRIPFDVQWLIVKYLLDELPLFHHAKFDARGNGQELAEKALQLKGPARVECVMATPTWYAANFPPYKAALEEQSVEIAQGEDVIADHRRVILKNGYPTMDDGRDKGSDGEQRHGDGVIGRVMAWAATRQEGQPAAGASVDPAADAFMPDRMLNRRRATMFRKAA